VPNADSWHAFQTPSCRLTAVLPINQPINVVVAVDLAGII
jgi:hypothetical protein